MRIEQAIFTSADTDRAQGYQIVSRSPGLSEADARELAVWGPSHDSLVERPGKHASTNFFRLASGQYCVSRTVLAGAEYSGRGGELVYTQFLIVPADILARFRNNPFAILRAAMAIGALEVREHFPESLEPLRLGGRSATVDLALLAQLAIDPGPTAMATLIQAALASDHLAVASGTPCEQLIAGLINLLPVECRIEFSFSTGLKYSPSRPVRIACLPEEPSSWRATARSGVTLLDLNSSQLTDELSWKGWAGYVSKVIRCGKFSLFAAELEPSRPTLTCAGLNQLADELEAHLDSQTVTAVGVTVDKPILEAAPAAPAALHSIQQRADQPHLVCEKSLAATPQNRIQVTDKLANTLAAQPREVLELLERIDDLVFTAISGDDRALAELEVLWPTVAAELDTDLVEQSREQYLRCALSICGQCVEGDVHRPERAAAAIDVLCVLFEE